jgi:hypothetical protein
MSPSAAAGRAGRGGPPRGRRAGQLGQQQITFKTADTLTAEEKQSACLVQYAGQQLTTGKQAECYANEFIGLHLKSTADGKTYAELGDVQTDLRAKIAALPKDDPAVAGLQKQLTDTTAQRETVFKGETLRGLLLTSYGFSEFGAKAALVAGRWAGRLHAAATLAAAQTRLIPADAPRPGPPSERRASCRRRRSTPSVDHTPRPRSTFSRRASPGGAGLPRTNE